MHGPYRRAALVGPVPPSQPQEKGSPLEKARPPSVQMQHSFNPKLTSCSSTWH